MNCPLCPFEGAPRALHAHLAEAHPEEFGERVVGAVFADTAAAELVRGAAGLLGLRLIGAAPSLGRRFTDLITRDVVRRRASGSIVSKRMPPASKESLESISGRL